MSDRKVKGTLMNAFLAFIKKKWGLHGVERALEYAGMTRAPKNGEFVAMAKAYRLLDWIAEAQGEEYILQAGKELPKQMGGDLKFMLGSVMGFERLLKRVPREISKVAFGEDHVKINIDGRSAQIFLKGFRMDEKSCIFWKGVLLGVMGITKTSGTVEIKESDNEKDCVLKAVWE